MADWIKTAVGGNKGKFAAKAERAGKTTKEFASEHEHDSGTLGSEARLAETLMGSKMQGKTERSKRNRTLYDRTKD